MRHLLVVCAACIRAHRSNLRRANAARRKFSQRETAFLRPSPIGSDRRARLSSQNTNVIRRYADIALDNGSSDRHEGAPNEKILLLTDPSGRISANKALRNFVATFTAPPPSPPPSPPPPPLPPTSDVGDIGHGWLLNAESRTPLQTATVTMSRASHYYAHAAAESVHASSACSVPLRSVRRGTDHYRYRVYDQPCNRTRPRVRSSGSPTIHRVVHRASETRAERFRDRLMMIDVRSARASSELSASVCERYRLNLSIGRSYGIMSQLPIFWELLVSRCETDR